jgi:hypothetical protein
VTHIPAPTPEHHRAYVSGPMGLFKDTDWNFPAFDAVAARWRAEGWLVFNPAEQFDRRTDLPRHIYMRADIEALLEADTIVLLPRWNESPGALLELQIAIELGLAVHHATGWPARVEVAVAGRDALDIALTEACEILH